MENCLNPVVLHPHYLDILFAFKSKVSNVFRDVLGIHEIHHIALTQINSNNELISLSSTPAMEFNLFSSLLWRYDHTYHPQWFNQCTQDDWQTLYHQERYDELYYLKQIKHNYPIGLSLAGRLNGNPMIYSLASHNSCVHTQNLFSTQFEIFYKIGQYCSNMLAPLFNDSDLLTSPSLSCTGDL